MTCEHYESCVRRKNLAILAKDETRTPEERWTDKGTLELLKETYCESGKEENCDVYKAKKAFDTAQQVF